MKYKHFCQMCGNEWEDIGEDPKRCRICKSKNWKNGRCPFVNNSNYCTHKHMNSRNKAGYKNCIGLTNCSHYLRWKIKNIVN